MDLQNEGYDLITKMILNHNADMNLSAIIDTQGFNDPGRKLNLFSVITQISL